MSNNATSTPEAGQVLAGKYRVEEVLGVGGMGVVVAATHLQLDQRVAIKYLLPAALLNPEVVERFAREARAAAKIRGEHVARVIDVGQFDDGAPYMVMEHLDGHDLAKHLELYGPLPVEDAVRFLLETCEALAEAHSAKIVHRDLKPSNMFLAKQPDKSAIIKVLDFGISKTGDAPSASLTKTSALMGTAFYMSPEQLTTPKGVDHRSDIWSLGVILYELLAGKPPFLGESIPEIIGAILSNQADGVRTMRAEVPVGLEAVIEKCMRSKAADRYQNVAALAIALGPFAHMRDRLSVEITARVLGESVTPQRPPTADGATATVMLPLTPAAQTGSAAEPAVESPGAAAPSKPPASTPPASTPPSADTAPAVAAVTTHGMSTSAITAKPKRSSTPLIAAAILLVAIGGTAAGLKLASSGNAEVPPVAATGLVEAPPVEAPPTAAPTAAATGTTTLLPAAAPTTDPPAAVPTPTAAAPRVHAPQPAVKPPTRASAAPAKSAKAPAVPPASATAAPVAAPTSSSKSNPLQMGIK